MELRPALEGFAGIPQETRLLFAFLQSPEKNIQVDGLLNTYRTPYRARYTREEPIFRTYEQAKYVLEVYDPWEPESRAARFAFYPRRLMRHGFHAFKSTLGFDFKLLPFEANLFPDFIWQKVFSKTLPPEAFTNVMARSYFMNTLGWYEMHRAGTLTAVYPQLNTQDWDFVLMQTPFPGRVSKNSLLLIRYHDAIPLYLPQHISNPRRHMSNHFHALKMNAKFARFVCTSAPVMNDLLRLLPELEGRATVIPDVVSDAYFPEKVPQPEITDLIWRNIAPETAPKFTNSQEKSEFHRKIQETNTYLLAVGTVEPRKNYSRLLSAWQELYASTAGAIKLILVGDLGWKLDRQGEHRMMLGWEERGALFHLTHVPTAALRKLYSNALAVVCPSVSEGFDYSGVEAMRCNTTVIASDIAAHRSVYQDAALYFNPYSVSDLAKLIKLVLGQKEVDEHRMLLLKKGREVGAKYSADAVIPQWHSYLASLQAQRC